MRGDLSLASRVRGGAGGARRARHPQARAIACALSGPPSSARRLLRARRPQGAGCARRSLRSRSCRAGAQTRGGIVAEKFLLAGVMGFPVMHSRSPKLHNYWLAHYGLQGTYVPLAIPREKLGEAMRALAALGFAGCNLTIPHKQAALELVDKLDPLARRIGAVNCVVVAPDGSLAGYNHDAFGYIESIREAHPGWRADAGSIVVIGAGGVARAVLVGLIERGAREIRLVNRTPARAKELELTLGRPIRAIDW